MRRFAGFAVLFSLFFVAGAAAHAQVGIYAMGSGGFLGSYSQNGLSNDGFAAFGGTIGVYDQFVHLGPVRLGADGRYFGESGSNANSYGNHLHGAVGGARVAFQSAAVPLKPYLQAEFGVANTNYGVQPNTNQSFAYQVQGGIDFTVLPHLDIRVEYGAGQMNGYYGGTKQALEQGGVGLVLRL